MTDEPQAKKARAEPLPPQHPTAGPTLETPPTMCQPPQQPPTAKLEAAFGSTDWATFTESFPNWEKDLTGLDKSTLDNKLVLCRFDGRKTPAMATALLEHFHQGSRAAAVTAVHQATPQSVTEASTQALVNLERHVMVLVDARVKELTLNCRPDTSAASLTTAELWDSAGSVPELPFEVVVGDVLPSIPPDFARRVEDLQRQTGGPGSDETTVVQPAWTTFLREISTFFPTITVADRHMTKTLGCRKPDIVIHRPGISPTVTTMLAVGELKGGEHPFSSEELGQLLDYLKRIMGAQTRRKVIGFLANRKCLKFISLDDAAAIKMTPCFEGELWQHCLFSFFSQNHHTLGPTSFTVGRVTYFQGKLLGKGRFCEVYAAESFDQPNTPMVIKIYRSPERAEWEAEMLGKWDSQPEHLGNRIPKVIACSGCMMVVTPKAKTFNVDRGRRITFTHITKIVEVLRHCHTKLNLVHRDMKEDNIFLSPTDSEEVIINDWSCAAELGVVEPHEGAPKAYRHFSVRDQASFATFPGQDLYALLVAVLRLQLPTCNLEPQLPVMFRPLGDVAHCGDHAAFLNGMRQLFGLE